MVSDADCHFVQVGLAEFMSELGALASFRRLDRITAFHRTGSKPTCFFLLSTVLRGIPRVERAVPISAKFLALREVDGRAPAEQPLDAEYDANPLRHGVKFGEAKARS